MPKLYRLAIAALLIPSLSLAACVGPAASPAIPATAPSIISTLIPVEPADPTDATEATEATAATAASTATPPAPNVAGSASPTPAAPGQVEATVTIAPSAPTSAPGMPQFSHSAVITNPFYPVSDIEFSISLGQEAGKPAREDVALVPGTKTITWNGQTIEARVSQYTAYSDGYLVEIAYDYFAQADDGGLYYLGEDVANYSAGEVVNHSGSWLAGKDGAPPALIMPAHPAVGMTFNPENVPGLAYETDQIMSLAETTTTPGGPVADALLVKEMLMEGTTEYKVNAAGWGIVESRAQGELFHLVWLNRTDAKPGTVPDSLSAIEAQAEDIFDVVPGNDWAKVAADVTAAAQAWQAYLPQATRDQMPQPFQEAISAALDRLQTASAAHNAAGTLQAANDLSAAVIDLYTVYHPATPTDIGRLDVLERQVGLDVAGGNFTAVADTVAKTAAVWARLKPAILAHSGASVAAQFDDNLTTQQTALKTRNGSVLTAAVDTGLSLVDSLERRY